MDEEIIVKNASNLSNVRKMKNLIDEKLKFFKVNEILTVRLF